MIAQPSVIPTVPIANLEAIIFDLDGVMTKTADVHAAAWKAMFDQYLQDREVRYGEQHRPFDIDKDYLPYVDGKPRFDGVRDFLASRGISLPEGHTDDPPDKETIAGLGNRKNVAFRRHLDTAGVQAYDSSVAFVREATARGLHIALISASKNCRAVLQAAGIASLFEVVVDGVESAAAKLPGKPEPDVFLEAAKRLGVEPARAAIVEDAVAGVQAGAKGEFALVIGVDRTGNRAALEANGADVVVTDLAELSFGD